MAYGLATAISGLPDQSRRHRLLPAVVISDNRLVPQITVERGAYGGISLKRIVAVGYAVFFALGTAAFELPH